MRSIAKSANSPEKVAKPTVSFDTINDEETHKVTDGTELGTNPHNGPVQVITTNPNDKGTSLTLLYTLLELNNLDITGYTLSMGITLTTNPSFHRKVNVLIDTGL